MIFEPRRQGTASSLCLYNGLMFKRWVIRGVFLFLLSLCVVGWGWGYWRSDHFHYQPNYDQGNYPLVKYYVALDRGLLRVGGVYEDGEEWRGKFGHETRSPGISPFPYFRWENTTAYSGVPNAHIFDATLLGLGFRQYKHPPSGLLCWSVSVPCWLVVLFFGFTLSVVFRKTRPNINPASAFPIEISKGLS